MSTAFNDSSPDDNIRIGDSERMQADELLRQHLTAGRLSITEYDQRAASVYAARTRHDLDAVFGDLPDGPPGSAALSPRAATGRVSSASAPVAGSSNRQLLVGLMAALPIIAVILFFVTRSWLWFLLIPLMGALIGPYLRSGDDDSNRAG